MHSGKPKNNFYQIYETNKPTKYDTSLYFIQYGVLLTERDFFFVYILLTLNHVHLVTIHTDRCTH